MNLVETQLTPELAAHLLATPHLRQRRQARAKVEQYARTIREGRWTLVPDAILVTSDGQMFNGGHRCAAVVAAHRAIPVYICWDADPALFDVIDVGRLRSPYQFVGASDATAHASAARLTLWYQSRFDRPCAGTNMTFDLHLILAEADRRQETFEAVLPAARTTYEYTGIAKSVCLASYALAVDMGYAEEVQDFVDGIANPSDLDPQDPRRLIADRFRKQQHRARRRQAIEDWTLLVRALNLHLEGRKAYRLAMTDFWPRVAELETDFNRRRAALSEAQRRGRDDAHAHAKKAVAS